MISGLILTTAACSRAQLVPAQQGATQWQPAAGSRWVQRPMPTWPPSANSDYQPIDPSELAKRLPDLRSGKLVEEAHIAGDNPFVAQVSYCVTDGDTAAVAADVRATLDGAGWLTTDFGKQLAAATATGTQVARDGFVMTAYAAPGRWAGCADAKALTYVTFVAGKRR